jgi:DNA polymerase-3 subunit epsilon
LDERLLTELMMDTRDRRIASQKAQEWIESNPVYLDTETTGLGNYDEVIEIVVLDDQANSLYASLIKPRGKIDPEAGRIHGITQEMLVNAPSWMDVWPQAKAVLVNRRIGVYNVEFDKRLINQSCDRSGMPRSLPEGIFFDIMKIYAQFYGVKDPYRGTYRYQSLEQAGKQCNIPLPNAHRALADCLLARALLHHMADNP